MQQKNDTRIPVWERLHASSRRFVQNQQKTTPALFPPKEVGTTKNLPFHRSKTKTATKHKKEGMTSEVFCSKARSNTQPKKTIQSTSHVSLDNGSLTLEIAEGKLHDCTINSLEEVGDDQKTETSDSNADEPVTLDIKAYYEDIRPEMNAELKKTSVILSLFLTLSIHISSCACIIGSITTPFKINSSWLWCLGSRIRAQNAAYGYHQQSSVLVSNLDHAYGIAITKPSFLDL